MKNKLDELAIQIESTHNRLQYLINEYNQIKGVDDSVLFSLYKLSGSDDVNSRFDGYENEIANCLLSNDEFENILLLITAYKNFEGEK